jgi:hypothetical protein
MHRLGAACEHVGRHSRALARSAAKLRIGTSRNKHRHHWLRSVAFWPVPDSLPEP